MNNKYIDKLESFSGEIFLDIDNLNKAISLLEDDKYSNDLTLTLLKIRDITSYLQLIHSDLYFKYREIENYIKTEYEKEKENKTK